MSREKAITHTQPNTIEVSNAAPTHTQESPRTWMYRPDADIIQLDDAYRVVLDMPGVKPENIDLTVEKNVLRIHGRIGRDTDRTQDRFIRQEYGIGDYVRQFGFDETIDTERISAACHDGVVTIHLPRTEAHQRRRIPIANGSDNA